ncbi:sigma-E processing peptidase SpoIIGA [Halobacillus salinus]|uniref:sigma-E processing peptidase SpoIIGA n=1 Tax=Halobacillus salinus TaxID=192814 RepID=UPI00349F92AC
MLFVITSVEEGVNIYLDAVWLLNILMDAMILNLTLGLTRAKSSKFRLFSAALIASSLVPLTIYMPHHFLTSSLGKALISLVIIWVAFRYSSLRAFFMQWISFYFITFAIGGTMMGVHFFLTTEMEVQGGTLVTFSGGYGDPVSWCFVLIGFPCSYFFTKWRFSQVAVHQMKMDQVYEVEVQWNGKTAKCHGMVDSGNQLVDPISRKMVFLADRYVIEQLIDEVVVDDLTMDQVATSMDGLPGPVQDALRLVPFQAAGHAGQLLVTLTVDSVVIHTESGPLNVQKPLLGVQQSSLTHDNTYQMLIHPHAMVRGKSA